MPIFDDAEKAHKEICAELSEPVSKNRKTVQYTTNTLGHMIELMDLSETGEGAGSSSWKNILTKLKTYEAALKTSASDNDKRAQLSEINTLIQAYLSDEEHQRRTNAGRGDWHFRDKDKLPDKDKRPDTAPAKGPPSKYMPWRSTEEQYNHKVALRYALLRELEPRVRSELGQLASHNAPAQQDFSLNQSEWRGGAINSVDLVSGGGRQMVFKAEVPYNTDEDQSANAVASSKLDRALDAGGVTNQEEFAVRIDADDRTGFPALMGTVQERIHGESLQDALKNGHLKNIDFTSNDVQQTLNRLQLLDMISGQADRHNGNIMFDDVHHRMVGVDGDRSFSDYASRHTLKSLRVGHFSVGVPELIDDKVGKNILNMDDKTLREIISSTIPGMLTQETIKACTARLHLLQDELRQRQKDGKFVQSWDGDTFTEQLKDWDPNNKGNNRVSYAMHMWLDCWLQKRVSVYRDHKSLLKSILGQALKAGAGDPGALETVIDAMEAGYRTGTSSQAGTDPTKDADYLEFEKRWAVRTLTHLIRSPGSAVEPSFDAWHRQTST